MNSVNEASAMKTTSEFYICPKCNSSKQFVYFVVNDKEGQYYLGTKCPRDCGHIEEFKAVSYRIASEYIVSKYSN